MYMDIFKNNLQFYFSKQFINSLAGLSVILQRRYITLADAQNANLSKKKFLYSLMQGIFEMLFIQNKF